MDDGECKELTIKVIDAFEHEEVVPFVTKCLAKTSRGGTVSFHGKCLESLCGAVWLGDLEEPDFNKMKPFVISLNNLSEILENLGAKIIEKKLNDFDFFVKAER